MYVKRSPGLQERTITGKERAGLEEARVSTTWVACIPRKRAAAWIAIVSRWLFVP